MHLYHGNDKYLSLRAAQDKYEQLVKLNESFDARIIDAENFDFSELLDSILGGSLFFTGKILFIKRVSKSKQFNDNVEMFFEAIGRKLAASSDKLKIVFWEDEKIKSNSRYLKHLKGYINSASVVCIDALGKRDLSGWVINQLKSANLVLDSEQIDLLLRRSNYDAERVVNEINKLQIISEDGTQVTAELIEQLVADTFENQVWDLTDAINSRNSKRALEVYENIVSNGYDDFLVLNSISRNLDQVILIKSLTDEGLSRDQIIKKIKVHPFVFSKISGNVDKYSWDLLKKIYEKINNIDYESKRGGVDSRVAITVLLGIL